MDNLLVKLSEILEMSVEGVIQYYPILRNQLMAYNILNSLQIIFIGMMLITPMLVMVGAMILDAVCAFDMEEVFSKKNIKYLIRFFGILFVATVLASVSRYVLARDLMMLRHFL